MIAISYRVAPILITTVDRAQRVRAHTHAHNWMSFSLLQVAIRRVTLYCAVERGKDNRGVDYSEWATADVSSSPPALTWGVAGCRVGVGLTLLSPPAGPDHSPVE